MSHNSVGIGWVGVLHTALVGRLLCVGTCVGSVDMIYVPVFEFVVSISVASVYSVVMEWMEVLCSALSVSVVGFRVFAFVVSVSVSSVHSVVMEWMEIFCSALSVSVVGFQMRWLSVVGFRMRYLLYPITS